MFIVRDGGWRKVLQAGITSLNCWPEHNVSSTGTSSFRPSLKQTENATSEYFKQWKWQAKQKGNSFGVSLWPLWLKAHTSCHVSVLIVTGGLCYMFFPYPLELINSYLHYYSYTSCMLTNCRLTSLLKQPDLGMSDCLCLVLGYWQPLVHSHCSLACLLWFHKQSEWPIYFSEGGEVTLLVDQQAGKLARSNKALMCGTIKGLTTDWSIALICFLCCCCCWPANVSRLFLLPWIVLL